MEREIGRGSRAVVYEATQLSLHRLVALKLLDRAPVDGVLQWPEHPHAVSLYGAGLCDEGYFVAMQLVRGPSLSELRPADRLRALGEVADALDAAHRGGIAHGAVVARNVLIGEDGRAYLSDFGLAPGTATPAGDLADFAALVSECLGVAAPSPGPGPAHEIVDAARDQVAPPPSLRWPWVAVGLAVLGALAAVVLAVSSRSSEQVPEPPPGVATLGSALPSTGAQSVDCEGQVPSGASQPCIVVDGRPAGESGVIRRWAVRDARGELALEVLRRGGGGVFVVGRTDYMRVRDTGVHLLPANLPVRAGDFVGLDVAPGAAIGVRRAAGATTRRLSGPADLVPGAFDSTTSGQELLLRVEYVPGATWKPSGLRTGSAAASAPDGRVLDSLEPYPGFTVAAVRVGGRVAADLLNGKRRLARLFLPGADPAGRLGSLYTLRLRFGVPLMRLLWRNPDGVVSRDFAARRDGLVPID